MPCQCGIGPIRIGVYDDDGRRNQVSQSPACRACGDTGWTFLRSELRMDVLAQPYVILAPGVWDRMEREGSR